MEYTAVIGLEAHVHLNTRSKAFCGCSTQFGSEPNSQVCPVCLGFPGSLPVLNRTALEYAITVAVALNCRVQEFTKFDRKHYYYPDLPKNYQISQYDLPVALEGFLDIQVDGKVKRIRIRRAHLEEDAGKLIHRQDISLVDFNRAGVPLLEIVSEPDINSPQEAYAYLTFLKSIIEYLGVSDCDMEKGSLRCDANISLIEKGQSGLGTKSELKNMNSFKAVKDALSFEIERQSELLSGGGVITQETRLWDAKGLRTISMRSKEEAKDYRYFPDPDLSPFTISQDTISRIKQSLPELPREKQKRLADQYGLSDYDAELITSSRQLADYFEECLKGYANAKAVFNWLSGPVLSELNSRGVSISGLNISPEKMVELVKFFQEGKVTNLVAKDVLGQMIQSGKAAADIIEQNGLAQISDAGSLKKIIDQVLEENTKSVGDYKAGKSNALMFLLGQVMKKSQGKANPKTVADMLKTRLGGS
jgi:aspartyl-tRNA(Asn)/glutamyl-tRNA(Gln) amidotransferase subunit B